MANIIPTKTLCYISIIKPWRTRDIKAVLNRKKFPIRNGDKEDMKKVQTELRDKNAVGKESKFESKLQQNNLREMWSGIRTITGHGTKTNKSMMGDLYVSNDRNFFNRFDDIWCLPTPSSTYDSFSSPSSAPSCPISL